MRHAFVAMVIGISICSDSLAAEPADPLSAKKKAWQDSLEKAKFCFSDSYADVLYYLSQYQGDCKIHIIYDPNAWWGLTFKFERDGKDVLSLHGHAHSVFCTANNVLYFAHFTTSSDGCTVSAYDLTTGKKLWTTELSAVGHRMHSRYRNAVMMGLSSSEPDSVLIIKGRESFGDYSEILDRSSGKVIAHKIYRQGFGE